MKESESECPSCFGDKKQYGKIAACSTCEYHGSCEFCANDDGSGCDRRLGHVSYERYSYSKEVSSRDADKKEDSSNIQKVLEFLLDLDNYTAELVHEVLHGNSSTTPELAEKFGVSRQAIHRKLIDACTEHPELRKVFITRLCGCRRILSDSDRITRAKELKRRKNRNEQMEFKFDA